MKTVLNFLALILTAGLFLSLKSLSGNENQNTQKNSGDKMVVDLGAMGAISQNKQTQNIRFSEIMRDVSFNSRIIKSDTLETIAFNSVPTETGSPDVYQKITFASVAGIIGFIFCLLALFGTNLINDSEINGTRKISRFSVLKTSIVFLIYLIAISFPISLWIFGSSPGISFSLILITFTAITTGFMHNLLNKPINKTNQKQGKIEFMVEIILPASTLFSAMYLIVPAWINNHFGELPVQFVIVYLLMSMVHLGKRALNSSLVHSAFAKELFHQPN